MKEEFFDDDTVNQSEPINCLLQTASLDFNIKTFEYRRYSHYYSVSSLVTFSS